MSDKTPTEQIEDLDLDLSLYLQPQDVQQMLSKGVDPGECTAVELQPMQFAQGTAPNGQLFLQLLVPIPPDFFVQKKRLVLPGGKTQNELDGAIVTARVTVGVRKDRLTEQAKNNLQKGLKDQIQMLAQTTDAEG